MENIIDNKIVKPFNTEYLSILSYMIGASILGVLFDMLLGIFECINIIEHNHQLGLFLLISIIVLDTASIVGCIQFFSEKKVSAYIIFGVSAVNIILLSAINAGGIDAGKEIARSFAKIIVLAVLFTIKKSDTGLSAWHILGFVEIEDKTVHEWNLEYWRENNPDAVSDPLSMDISKWKEESEYLSAEQKEPESAKDAIVEIMQMENPTNEEICSIVEDNDILIDGQREEDIVNSEMEQPANESEFNNPFTANLSLESENQLYEENDINSDKQNELKDVTTNEENVVDKRGTSNEAKKTYKKVALFVFAIIVLILLVVLFVYRQNAENRVAEAYTNVKSLLEKKAYTKVDSVNIENFYEKAIEKRDTSAILYVGKYHINSSNYSRALSVFEKGYDFGSIKCLKNIVSLYMNKDLNKNGKKNTLVDFAKAVSAAKEMAEYDRGLSCYLLGNIYSDKKDNKLAVFYWEKGAELNNLDAMNNLAWAYLNGIGCKENHAKSFELFSKIVEKDSTDGYASFHLGIHYYYGLHVPKDIMRAKLYIKKAADLGDEDAIRTYVEFFK